MYTKTENDEAIKEFTGQLKDIIENAETLDSGELQFKLQTLKEDIREYSEWTGGNDARFTNALAKLEEVENELEEKFFSYL